jgi:hypothetical protein
MAGLTVKEAMSRSARISKFLLSEKFLLTLVTQ